MSKRPAISVTEGGGGGTGSKSKFDFFKKPKQQRSKYQEYGPGLTENLRSIKSSFLENGGDVNDASIYEHQLDAVLKTRAMIEGEPFDDEPVKPVLIVAPTGSGKSGMIVLLPYVLSSRKVLVITPSKEITEQLAVAFGKNRKKESFLEIAVGGSDMTEKDKRDLRDACEHVTVIRNAKEIIYESIGNLVIVNAQKFGGKSGATLNATYGKKEVIDDVKEFFAHFDTLLVDEAHHFPAKTWNDIVEAFKGPAYGDKVRKKIIFLTATPSRMSKGKPVKILEEQRVAFKISLEELEGKTIRRSRFIEREGYHDVEDYEVLARDLKELLGKNKRAEDRIRRHQAMVYVRTKDDALELARGLNLARGRENFALAIFARPSKEKDVESFNAGEYQVAVVCGSLKEGYDNSNVSLVAILKNMRSRPAFSQFVGRCLRMSKFKGGNNKQVKDRTTALILSYTGFKQGRQWDEFENLASSDPVVDDDNEEEFYYE